MKEFPAGTGPVRVSPGETWYREVDLEAGDFLRVAVEQEGIDVALRLLDAAGETVLRIDSPTGRFGPEELLTIVAASGRYRWTVEALAGEPAASDVRLLEAASRPATAADRELVAADQADRRGRALERAGDAGAAVEALQQALQVFTSRELAWRQAETLLSLGEAQAMQGALAAAAGSTETAVALHRQEDRRHRLAHALELAGFRRLQLGEPEPARMLLEEARTLLETLGDTRLQAAVLARLGSAYQALGQSQQAVGLLREALERFQSSGSGAEQEAVILSDLAWALLAAGKADEATERFAEATNAARSGSFTGVLRATLRGAADAASRDGRHAAATASIEEALALVGAGADPRERMTVLLTSGQVLRRKENFEAARAPLEEALGLARQVGDRRSEAILLLELGYAATRRGEPGRGLELCEAALVLFTAIGDRQGQTSAARRSQEALAALQASSAASSAEVGTFFSLSGALGPDGAPNEDVAQIDRFHDIEGPAVPKRPANVAGTDLPGDEDKTWKPDEATLRRLEEARLAELRRHIEAERRLTGGGPLTSEHALSTDPREGDGGDPLLELEPRQLTDLFEGSSLAGRPALLDELRLCREYEGETRHQVETRRHWRELPSDIDPHDLAVTGWGIVFARGEDPEIEYQLRRLIERRESQAGKRFKRLDYWHGDSGRTFLWERNGEAPGTIDPETLPYYLLLIGSPEQIPFEVQYQLSINHAVGRICFGDPKDYGRYAERVLETEDEGAKLPRRATIFSAENGDRATDLLAAHLVAPLEKRFSAHPCWELAVRRKEQARKEDLPLLLGGAETPGLLLVSCHGKPYPAGHPSQRECQGALLCQEVPGGEDTFQASDLDPSIDLGGLVAFLFACYGAGTPVDDNFPFLTKDGTIPTEPRPRQLAEKPFVARLPQALLRQGALAVVGHVDRGWTLSFAWTVPGAQTSQATRSLEDSLQRLLDGHRLGHALRPLYLRYTALAAQLAGPIENFFYGKGIARDAFAAQWIAHNDARNFIILGDPAVYLLGKRPESQSRDRAESQSQVRLEEAMLATVVSQAAARGLTVEAWVNRLVRERLSAAGG